MSKEDSPLPLGSQERFFVLAVLRLQEIKIQAELNMNGLIYLIGLIVVIMAVLSLRPALAVIDDDPMTSVHADPGPVASEPGPAYLMERTRGCRGRSGSSARPCAARIRTSHRTFRQLDGSDVA